MVHHQSPKLSSLKKEGHKYINKMSKILLLKGVYHFMRTFIKEKRLKSLFLINASPFLFPWEKTKKMKTVLRMELKNYDISIFLNRE